MAMVAPNATAAKAIAAGKRPRKRSFIFYEPRLLLFREPDGSLFAQSRDRQRHFAAAVIAGVLGRFLVLDFGIDDALQVRPLDGLRNAAAVDEHGRRARNLELACLFHLGVDFGL